MVKIKLCGLSRFDDIEAANRLKPEYTGFVFAKKSIRYVDEQTAAELKKKLDPDIKAVGVFVDESPEMICGLLKKGVIDAAQLHGNEDEAYIKALKNMTDRPVIKAFRMNGRSSYEEIEECSADLVLLDSADGGSGETFDWAGLQMIKRPFFLAGGLSSENIADVIRMVRPFGVDVSSGIETGGVKDIKKMNDFVRTVREI